VKGVANFIYGMVLVATVAIGQTVPTKKELEWNTLDRLCGDLLHVKRHIGRKDVTEETKALKNIVLRVYERNDAPCCNGASALGEAKTTSGGKFTFTSLKPGDYWLVALITDREYRLPLRLQPTKGVTTVCSDQRFEVYDSGDFKIGRVITVD